MNNKMYTMYKIRSIKLETFKYVSAKAIYSVYLGLEKIFSKTCDKFGMFSIWKNLLSLIRCYRFRYMRILNHILTLLL